MNGVLINEFPDYKFELGKSTYKDEEVGEGGYVYAEPGMYENVALLDVASMHPTSIILLNLFGEYTPKFADLKAARLAIKHKNYAAARKMLGGKLAPYLEDEAQADALSYALKIVINIVYGLTSAKFDNAFRDNRNVDNIVAKRGALFMIDLKHHVQDNLGVPVIHIKTDSIKIPLPKDDPEASEKIVQNIIDFGILYGYEFEHEGTYDKFCLVNDAVYIARKTIPVTLDGNNRDAWKLKWDAVGAQFQHPYVYKTLFTKEPIIFDDLCETKQVTQGAMYLDLDITRPMFLAKDVTFVGRTGRFVPVTPESGGGVLWRIKEDKHYAVAGTKGYLWMEAELARLKGDEVEIDMSYFDNLADEAKKTIEKFGYFDEFVS